MEPITIFFITFTIDGVIRLLAGNSTRKSIKTALDDWIDQPASPGNSFRFIYTDIQNWGSIEYCAKRIINCGKSQIEVEIFDDSRFKLPLYQISKIYSPEGKTIWGKVAKYEQSYYDRIFNLGINNLKTGNYNKAIQDWEEAIRLNDKHAQAYEAYNNRGFAYYNLGDYQRAILDYSHAIRLNPKSAEAYNNRGNAYYQLKDYERAVTNYNKAVNIDPKYAQASKNLVAAQKKLDELSGNSKQILTRIEIIPPLGFVLGSRHIFSVKAFDQNNQEMSIGQVAWHTTGGKIDRDGTFQAGQTPGRFTVTATVGSQEQKAEMLKLTVPLLLKTGMSVEQIAQQLHVDLDAVLKATEHNT